LIFLGLLVLIPLVRSAPAENKTAQAICQRDGSSFAPPDFVAPESMKLRAPNDYEIAFEETDELLRVENQQRIFAVDHALMEPKVPSKATPKQAPNISPPLLV
jgi:hypothetical protein